MPNESGAAVARTPFVRLPFARLPFTWRARTPAASTAVFVATFAALAGLIGLLLLFDLSLARIDRLESRAHATAEYEAGAALLARGRAAGAAERFGAAVAIDRDNLGYSLALARALLAQGRASDAESTVQPLLDRAENDGAVNLVMAHTMLRLGRPGDATSYFHRAIFGRWGADSTTRRAEARAELIDLLAGRGATQELLAELLPLEDAPPDSVALRKRVGLLFIRAGSPARGAAMLRDVLRRDPRDPDAYAGMGEAALALGNFRTARADFAEALDLRPGDARLEDRLALADTVLAIDPAARGIGSRARFERSRMLLARTVAAIDRCGGREGAVAAGLDSAGAMLHAAVRPRAEDAAGEAMLTLANDLWSARPARCASADRSDEALGIVHGRIGR